MNKYMERTESDLAVEEPKSAVKRPRRFKVILLNDDYTPMEFVILILKELFFMDEEKATRVMLQIHIEGKGVCGVYTRDVAETKVKQVSDFAQIDQHPLFCDIEPE